jgi:drug/metabolite transporter (DMT)-like permease
MNLLSTTNLKIYYHNITKRYSQPSLQKEGVTSIIYQPILQEDRTDVTYMKMPNKRTARLGYVYVVLAAVLWASSGSAAKFLFHSGVSPFQLVQLRATISGALLFLWLLAAKRSLLKIERKNLVDFFLLGSALAATQFTYLYTISRINVAPAILLQYQAPVLIAGHAMLFKHRRLSPFTLAALLGSITGCYLMVGAYRLEIFAINRHGIISGLICAFAFAIYSVKSEYSMRSYKPWTVVFYSLLAAAVIWNVLEPPLAAFTVTYSSVSWWWIFFICVFGTILPYGLYNEGINLILPTRASITATLEPVTAGVISFFFLGEVMGAVQVIGAGLVIASILILQIKKDPG